MPETQMEARERKRRRKKRIRALSIFAIFAYMVLRSLPGLFFKSPKTIYPEEVLYEDKSPGEGVLILNESLVTSQFAGNLDVNIKEGDRVGGGQLIGVVRENTDNSHIEKELEVVNNSIEQWERLKEDLGPLDLPNDDKLDQIRRLVNKGEYEKVYLLKEDKLEEEETTSEITDLLEKKDQLESMIESSYMEHYSISGGLISFNIDGFEDINYNSMLSLSRNTLKKASSPDEDKGESLKTGDPIFKIIDNYFWYLALDKKDFNLEVNKEVLVNFTKESKRLRGLVSEENQDFYFVKFTTGLHELYKDRFPRIEIINRSKRAYRIPSSVIFERDGLGGVYIKDLSGVVKFRPIELIDQEGDYSYIGIGDEKSRIKLDNDELAYTVMEFNEIIANPNNIKEGTILN